MKRCARCGETKELEAFHRLARSKDGRQPWCKACRNAAMSGYYADYMKTPEYVERRRAQGRVNVATWRERHPEKVKAMRAAGAERAKLTAAAWRKANPERVRANVRRNVAIRRARMRNVLVIPFTQAELDARLSMYGHRCWMCGGEASTVDHVKPIVKGGAHCLANLRPACLPCNSSKNSRWPLERMTA